MHSKKFYKCYIVYICRVFQKGLNADKSYHYFDFLCKINISNVVFIHFKSRNQSQFSGKTMTSQAKWRLKPKQLKMQNMLCICQTFARGWFQITSKVYLSTSLCKNQAVGESEGSSDIGQTLQNGRLYCTKLPCEIIF